MTKRIKFNLNSLTFFIVHVGLMDRIKNQHPYYRLSTPIHYLTKRLLLEYQTLQSLLTPAIDTSSDNVSNVIWSGALLERCLQA